MAEPPLRFAALGLDHRHIYHQVGRLLELGCECAGYWTDGNPQPLGGFLERFPDLERVGEPGRLLDDPAIHLIVSAAVPAERAGIAMRSMRRGKDVMVDKPGVTSLLQLEEVKRVQAETGRIWSVDFSERRPDPSEDAPAARSAPMSWMARLQRVWGIELSRCPRCAGEVRLIATVTEPGVIARILEHLRRGEHDAPEPRAPPPLAA